MSCRWFLKQKAPNRHDLEDCAKENQLASCSAQTGCTSSGRTQQTDRVLWKNFKPWTGTRTVVVCYLFFCASPYTAKTVVSTCLNMYIARMPSSGRWQYNVSAATRKNLRPKRVGTLKMTWKMNLDGDRSSSGIFHTHIGWETNSITFSLMPLTKLRDRIKGAVSSCRRNPQKLIRLVHWCNVNWWALTCFSQTMCFFCQAKPIWQLWGVLGRSPNHWPGWVPGDPLWERDPYSSVSFSRSFVWIRNVLALVIVKGFVARFPFWICPNLGWWCHDGWPYVSYWLSKPGRAWSVRGRWNRQGWTTTQSYRFSWFRTMPCSGKGAAPVYPICSQQDQQASCPRRWVAEQVWWHSCCKVPWSQNSACNCACGFHIWYICVHTSCAFPAGPKKWSNAAAVIWRRNMTNWCSWRPGVNCKVSSSTMS